MGVSSAGSRDVKVGDGGDDSDDGGSSIVDKGGGDGIVVGAEGAFPVEIGFLKSGQSSEKDGGSGVGEEDDRVDDRMADAHGAWRDEVSESKQVQSLEEEIQSKRAPASAVSREDSGKLHDREAIEASGQGFETHPRSGGPFRQELSEDRTEDEEEEQAGDVGAWAADFGLFPHRDEEGGMSGDSLVDDEGNDLKDGLVGWGFVENEEAAGEAPVERRRKTGSHHPEAGGLGRDPSVDRGHVSDEVSPAGMEGGVSIRGSEAAVDTAQTVQGEPAGTDRSATNAGIADEASKSGSAPVLVGDVSSGMGDGTGSTATVNAGDGDRVIPAEASAVEEAPTRLRGPVGIFAGIRKQLGSLSNGEGTSSGSSSSSSSRGYTSKDFEKLETALRMAGGKLYGLNDRVSALSAALQRRPLIGDEKGAASAAAAAGELARLRGLLITGSEANLVGRPGEIRQAVKSAERRVREAERAVGKDIAALEDAESRRATALAALSACRVEFDAARARFTSSNITDDAQSSEAVSGALREAQAAVDSCTDRLGQPIQTLATGRKGMLLKDERLVTKCRALVRVFAARVEEACAMQQKEHAQRTRRSHDDAAWKAGERILIQARALRRIMLGPEGVARHVRDARSGTESGKDGGSQFRQALDKLDGALAEADRLRRGGDLPGEKSSQSSSISSGAASVWAPGEQGKDVESTFTVAAREAWTAAEELQKAGVEGATEAGMRAKGALALVSMALVELDTMAADLQSSSGLVDADGSVAEVIRVARRGLEKMSQTLGGHEGDDITQAAAATRRGLDIIEALITSGSLESALGGVDAARAAITRTRRVTSLEKDARKLVAKENAHVNALSREARSLGLLERPAVARALQACRASATTAERFDSRGKRLAPGQREKNGRRYMEAAVAAGEATFKAHEILSLERDAAASNDEARRRLGERMQPSVDTVTHLEKRLERLTDSARLRCKTLEVVKETVAGWDAQVFDSRRHVRSLQVSQVDPDTRAAVRATVAAKESLDAIRNKAQKSKDVRALNEGMKACLERLAFAEAEVTKAESVGRRRDCACLTLERAATKTGAAVAAAREARLNDRPNVVAAVSAAVSEVEAGIASTAVPTAASDVPPGAASDVDDVCLAAVRRAEEASERAGEILSKERLLVEEVERQRQETSSELWSTARRLEGLDTDSVVGDDPEAVAVVLEARSEAVQALVILEAATDPTDCLEAAQIALDNAVTAEECLLKAKRSVQCFDDAAYILEQAEVRVAEAKVAMKAASVSAASRTAFEDVLEAYEKVLNSTVEASDDGADAFMQACNAALVSAREVERVAFRARRRVRSRADRRRRELARLDRPAAALVALDISDLTEGHEEVPSSRAVAERIRDALSAISAAREQVAAETGSQQRDETEETVLADRIDSAVHAAAGAERAFREARELTRTVGRWRREVARPESALARIRNEVELMPDAPLIMELCTGSLEAAQEALSIARASVGSVGNSEDGGGIKDAGIYLEEAVARVDAARRDVDEQVKRVKTAVSQRRMLRSALGASVDSLAQAQTGLEAEQAARSAAKAEPSMSQTQIDGDDTLSQALRLCIAADLTAAVARERLNTPMDSAWFRAVAHSPADAGSGVTAGAEKEEQEVETAQRVSAEAEEAAARVMERLGQVRGIRAKLRALLAGSEARFRRASAVLADAQIDAVNPGIAEAVQVASAALSRARALLRMPIGRSYLTLGGATDGGSGLARDEEAVSEARGYVSSLESFATSAAAGDHSRDIGKRRQLHQARQGESKDEGRWGSPTTGIGSSAPSDVRPLSGLSHAARDALTLAEQWSDALQAQISELRLGGDPAVTQAMNSARAAMLAAQELQSHGAVREDGRISGGTEERAAVEHFAAELGKLEGIAEDAAERQRAREAGLGAAARRLDRLQSTLRSLEQTVTTAGEPLISLTAEAMRTAWDASANAAKASARCDSVAPGDTAAENVGNAKDGDKDIQRRILPVGTGAPRQAVFVDAVQTTAVAVAQAEATVSRAREKASQVSAERVRALETLVTLAETLHEAGERLVLSSAERGLSASRETATTISEAQLALGKARAAAQMDAGAWLSGAAAIAEAVAEAGELVRLAKRSADGPVLIPRASRGPAAGAVTEEAVAEAEAHARAWLEEADAPDSNREASGTIMGGGDSAKPPAIERTARDTDARKAKIGFSENWEGVPPYLPLWMRLQKKAWDAGVAAAAAAAGQGGNSSRAKERSDPGESPPLEPSLTPSSASGDSFSVNDTADVRQDRRDDRPPVIAAADAVVERRREEENRLRAEADRLRAEAARLRRVRGDARAGRRQGASRTRSGRDNDASERSEAAETLAEERVKDFAARAKNEAQRRTTRPSRSTDSGDDSPTSPSNA